MDPLSVAISVFSLGSAIGKAVIAVTGFITDVRDAKADLDKVSRELVSLQGSIEALKGLNQNPALKALSIPQALKHNLYTILGNCKKDVTAVERLLHRLRSTGIRGKIEWTTSGRTDMSRLRSSLESNKMSLGISIGMINLTSTGDVKINTEAIREIVSETSTSVEVIREDVSTIKDSANVVQQNTNLLLSTTNRIAHSHEELLAIVRDLQGQMQELRLHQQTEGTPDTEETRTLELAQRVTDAALHHDENSSLSIFIASVDEDEDELFAAQLQREEYRHDFIANSSPPTPQEILRSPVLQGTALPATPTPEASSSQPNTVDLDFLEALRLQEEEYAEFPESEPAASPIKQYSYPQNLAEITSNLLCPSASKTDRAFREVMIYKASDSLQRKSRPRTLDDLITGGADVNIYLLDCRPLHLAVTESYIPLIHLLLAYGADPNMTNAHNSRSDSTRETPLHFACGNVPLSLEMVKLLVSYGAKVNIKDNRQRTPLHNACIFGHLSTVRYLINHGANRTSFDVARSTPLQLAVSARKFRVAMLLLDFSGTSLYDLHVRNNDSQGVKDILRGVARDIIAADGITVEDLLRKIEDIESTARFNS